MKSIQNNNLNFTIKEPCAHREDSLYLSFPSRATIARCKQCKTLLTLPRLSKKKIVSLYQDSYYEKNSSARFNVLGETLIKFFRFLRAYRASKYKPSSVLDIGCDRGYFLFFLRKYFKINDVMGTQYSENAINFAITKLHLDVRKGDIENINFGRKFDFICLWHVLEHIDKYENYLKEINKILEKKGKLLIEVPNSSSVIATITKKYWFQWDIPFHRVHFSSAILEKLLIQYDFKIIKKEFLSQEYGIISIDQSILNCITKSENYFYKSLQKNLGIRKDFRWLFHLTLFILLLVPSIMLNLLSAILRRGEVIRIIAEKK